MIRITPLEKNGRTVVIIEGDLAEADLKEVQKLRKSIIGPVSLALHGLNTCDAGGIRLLRVWLEAGARLETATPFLKMILKAPPPHIPTKGKQA